MKRLVLSLILTFLLPVVASAGTDAYIPLFAMTENGNMQTVINVSNKCATPVQVNLQFTKNDGNPLAEHPIRVNTGGADSEQYNLGTCTSDCVSPTNSYTKADGSVSVTLDGKHQMVLILLGNSSPYLTGWGTIDATTNECLLANGLIRNGPNNPTPYFRTVQISEHPF